MTLEQQERRILRKGEPGGSEPRFRSLENRESKNPQVTGLHISRRERGSHTFTPSASLIAASVPYPNSLARDNAIRSDFMISRLMQNPHATKLDGAFLNEQKLEESRVPPPSFASSHVEQQANAASSITRTKDLHVSHDPPRYLLLSWPTKLAAIISWEVSIPIKEINVGGVARHDNLLYLKDELKRGPNLPHVHVRSFDLISFPDNVVLM